MATAPDRTALARDIHCLLEQKPGQNKHQLHGALLSLGWRNITKSEINSVLYSYRNRFRHSDDVLPLWYPRAFAVEASPPLQAPQMLYYQGPKLRAWQSEAFDAWRAAGRRGVVEAVTGTLTQPKTPHPSRPPAHRAPSPGKSAPAGDRAASTRRRRLSARCVRRR